MPPPGSSVSAGWWVTPCALVGVQRQSRKEDKPYRARFTGKMPSAPLRGEPWAGRKAKVERTQAESTMTNSTQSTEGGSRAEGPLLAEHTPEPWRYETRTVSDFGLVHCIFGTEPGPICSATDVAAPLPHSDNFERMAACVNACVGIPTKRLSNINCLAAEQVTRLGLQRETEVRALRARYAALVETGYALCKRLRDRPAGLHPESLAEYVVFRDALDALEEER